MRHQIAALIVATIVITGLMAIPPKSVNWEETQTQMGAFDWHLTSCQQTSWEEVSYCHWTLYKEDHPVACTYFGFIRGAPADKVEGQLSWLGALVFRPWIIGIGLLVWGLIRYY